MHYEDKIYDITALEMFKRLEVFFTENGIPDYSSDATNGFDGEKRLTFSEKIAAFRRKHDAIPGIARIACLMREINGIRNDIVHPPDLQGKVNASIEPVVVLENLAAFQVFRGKCLRLEKLLHKAEKHTGMSEIMIPTLKYDMGNLGDIIKHGLLAEFADWWCAQDRPRMTFADTFAGCPWGGNLRVIERMKNLTEVSGNSTALIRAYTESGAEWGKYPRYLGSSHLVLRIGKNRNKEIIVLVSDRNINARANLRASGGLQMFGLPDNNDGFRILDDAEFGRYRPNLILLDPYGEFLREEFHSQCKKLRRIAKLTESNPSLWVALFVLDMWPENGKRRKTVQETHEHYTIFRDALFRDKAVFLHCPKAAKPHMQKPAIKGESEYDAEILLISEQLKNKNAPDIADLLQRLQTFAKRATEAFAKEPEMALIGSEKVEYHEV